MRRSWLIRGGCLLDPVSGREAVADLLVQDGTLAAPGTPLPPDTPTIDATGLVVVPGLIDLHVHLREPGKEAAETIDTGTAAAARGGFTHVVAMPNTTPPLDTPAAVRAQIDKGRLAGHAHVLPSACLTVGRGGREPADLAALAAAGAVAFTDDGSTVPDAAVLLRVMTAAAALGSPVMDHALDDVLAAAGVMHDGARSRQLALPGIPSRAEIAIVQRDIALARRTGCAMHIQHVSCRESAALIRAARRNGTPVSGEVTPHHLALCDAAIENDAARFKMSPPIRTAADRHGLQEAIADGTLQAFATDHAPHLAEEKARGFRDAPFGVVGLETAVGVTYTLMVEGKRMSRLEWLRRWTTGPAAVLNMDPPSLEAGRPANLTLLDLSSTWTVDPRTFRSKSRNTPFGGQTFTGQAVYTLCDGHVVWGIDSADVF